MRDNNQKIKLLRLYEMLRRETDEDHPLRTNDVCQRLIDMGISCDRRTLARDIALLNECDYEVMETRVGHQKAFYVADKSLEPEELQILIDAVQAANFITVKKTKSLVEKIASLNGNLYKKLKTSTHVSFGNCKHTNEQILIIVNHLHDALAKNKKVSFWYFDLDEHHKRIYRHDKKLYEVEPLALIYNEDNYYLLCYNTHPERNSIIIQYRVDRMENLEALDEKISSAAKDARKLVTDYTRGMFKMFGGEEKEVRLEFSPNLLSSVYDRFGENITVRAMPDNRLRVTQLIKISPPFYGWLFQFGTDMRIVSPPDVIEGYKNYAKGVVDSYFD